MKEENDVSISDQVEHAKKDTEGVSDLLRTHAIGQIQKVRAKNNVLWMDILRIAMERAPEQTKAVLNAINANDQEISSLVASLAKL